MSIPTPRSDQTPAEAPAEIASELHRSLTSYMDWTVRQWRALLANLDKKHQGYVPTGERDDLAQLRDLVRSAITNFERIGEDGAGRLDHLTPADLRWHDISAEIARNAAAGWALWRTVRESARDELAAGATAGQAVEGYQPRPIERAQFIAIRAALADGLQPRNGMEWLLIDGMAEAWVMHLRWLGKHTNLDSLDAIRVERDVRQRDGWEPPKLSEAEAVDRAVAMQDRFQRQFLRLMKCYRDGRRLIGSMTVLGGQVNVAERQIVADGTQPLVVEKHAERR
jgi:hypothetical protein